MLFWNGLILFSFSLTMFWVLIQGWQAGNVSTGDMVLIIALEQGKIVEDGTHEALSHAGGVYERLWNHQAGGFLTEE